jgi:hypothetical protein
MPEWMASLPADHEEVELEIRLRGQRGLLDAVIGAIASLEERLGQVEIVEVRGPGWDVPAHPGM